MRFTNTFRVALRALRRNTMRSILTALGIIIGVAAVITMVALGTGAANAQRNDDAKFTAAAKVLEARINGTPIEALCGHVWVPARDPKQLPVCQACKETYDMYKIFNDGLRDSPAD